MKRSSLLRHLNEKHSGRGLGSTRTWLDRELEDWHNDQHRLASVLTSTGRPPYEPHGHRP